MKVTLLLAGLSLGLVTVTNNALAECKSVMGACVKQDLVNSAPHMHSEYIAKTKVVHAAQNKTTTNVTAANKEAAKKTSTTGVYSTMQK